MNEERWEDLLDKIEQKFGIENYKKEDLYKETDDGKKKKHGCQETVTFNGRQGKMKLERVSKPVILDKKVYYSGRKSDAKVDYVFSDTEYMYKVVAYLWQGNEWKEIDFRL